MIFRSVDIGSSDCEYERAWKRPALKRKLYHKLDSDELSCLVMTGVFDDVSLDLNLKENEIKNNGVINPLV